MDFKLTYQSQLSATACFACYMIQITLGLGNNVEILKANPARYHDLLKARLLHQVWVVVGLAFVKVSICLFLLRLVARVLYVNVLRGIVAFMIVFTAASVLTLVSNVFVSQWVTRDRRVRLVVAESCLGTRFFNVTLSQRRGTTPCVRPRLGRVMRSAIAASLSRTLGCSTEV